MSQFLIPPPSKMDMSGDLVSNWGFFRDSWQNYATATKLADKDKKIVAATLLLPPQGFGREAKTRGGIIGVPA